MIPLFLLSDALINDPPSLFDGGRVGDAHVPRATRKKTPATSPSTPTFQPSRIPDSLTLTSLKQNRHHTLNA